MLFSNYYCGHDDVVVCTFHLLYVIIARQRGSYCIAYNAHMHVTIFSRPSERERKILRNGNFRVMNGKWWLIGPFFLIGIEAKKRSEREKERNQINYYLGGSMQMEYVLWVRVWAWLQASQSVNIKQRLIIHRKMRNVILPSDPILPSSPPTIPSESLFA